MTIFKRTLIKIDDIESISIIKPRAYDELITNCEILISLRNEEAIELTLQADSLSKLEFKEIDTSDWLQPKVYKGQSMSEQEE